MRSMPILLSICAIYVAPAVLSAQPNNQQSLAAIRAACADDAQKLCAGVQPGGGRIVACLKDHKEQLSDRCRQAAGLPANPGNSFAPGAAVVLSSAGAAAPSATSNSSGLPGSSSSKPASASKAATVPDIPAKASSANSTEERFSERVITDTEHQNMRAATIHLPEKWHFESKIEWHYNWIEYPLSYSSHAENPENAEAYFQYPLLRLESTEVPPQYRQYVRNNIKPGDRLPTGALSAAPQPPMEALAVFIQKTRSNVANFKWIGQQDLPDLAKALKLDAWPNDHGVAIKIGYDLDGQPVEEAFFGV